MIKAFDYFVNVSKLYPPIGEYKFSAKVPYIIKNPGDNFEHIHPNLHEWWGVTEDEAETKARTEADQIIQQIANKSH